MNLAELEKKLIAAARLQAPDERVPYAFEKRITALIAARSVADHWVFWARGLWRAAGSCVAVAVVLGAVSLFTPATIFRKISKTRCWLRQICRIILRCRE